MRSAQRFARSLLLVILWALPQSAVAAKPLTIGDGTPASCTEAALQEALAIATASGGGTIKFNCGGDPVTIPLTATLTLPNETTIDGDAVIALSGPLVGYLIVVDQNNTAVLKSLTITNPIVDGAGLLNEGILTIKDSTFFNNRGGGLSNEGTLTVKNSTFADNGDYRHSGGIFNGGTLAVKNSTFSGNIAAVGGALINSGEATINNSTFSGNSAADRGGAINGVATISNSLFSGNRCQSRGNGGALFGKVVTENSVCSGNTCGFGGALHGGGDITDSSFSHNSAAFQGGAIRALGQLTVRDSSITENTAGGAGGGIYFCCGNPPTLINTSVTG